MIYCNTFKIEHLLFVNLFHMLTYWFDLIASSKYYKNPSSLAFYPLGSINKIFNQPPHARHQPIKTTIFIVMFQYYIITSLQYVTNAPWNISPQFSNAQCITTILLLGQFQRNTNGCFVVVILTCNYGSNCIWTCCHKMQLTLAQGLI